MGVTFRKVADALTGAQTALADLRADIAAFDDGIAQVETRPPARADVLSSARREVEEQADIGRAVINRAATAFMADLDGKSFLARLAEPRDLRGILALAAGDRILAEFEATVARRWGSDPGLTDEEREVQLVDLHGQRFALELAEEAIIRSAAAAGLKLERRRDVHPAAILARDEDLPA